MSNAYDNLDIQNYEFVDFSGNNELNQSAVNYDFMELPDTSVAEKKINSRVLKVERVQAKKNDFSIDNVVMEHRGLKAQEESEFEQHIQKEVSVRIDTYKEDAMRSAYQEGLNIGRNEIIESSSSDANDKITALHGMISETLGTHEEIVKTQKSKIYDLVKNLTKWVILRELKDDGKYLERLLEKLIVELKSKSNLLIKVNQSSFENMPEVLEVVKKNLGELENTRVEIDYEINSPGIIIESENGIINGTFEEQLKSIDRLFDMVNIND